MFELVADASATWCFDPAYREFLSEEPGGYRFHVRRDQPIVASEPRPRCSAPGYWTLGECDDMLVFRTYHQDLEQLYQICTWCPEEAVGTFFSPAEYRLGEGAFEVPFGYPMDYLVYSKLFLRHHGYLLHGCAVMYGGRCLVFAGVKGAGKSTTARLWAGAGAQVLTEEQVVLRIDADAVRAYGSPWYGETRVCRNLGAPVDAVFFIEHGLHNEIVRLDPRTSTRELLRKLFLSVAFKEDVPGVLADCARLSAQVPVYRYSFVPNASAVQHVLDVV